MKNIRNATANQRKVRFSNKIAFRIVNVERTTSIVYVDMEIRNLFFKKMGSHTPAGAK